MLEFPVTFCVSASQRKQRMLKVGRICSCYWANIKTGLVVCQGKAPEKLFFGGIEEELLIKGCISSNISDIHFIMSKHRCLSLCLVSVQRGCG